MCLEITQPNGLVCTVVSLEGELSSQNCGKIDPKNDYNQGRVVRKPINANPGLKVNQHINFFLV